MSGTTPPTSPLHYLSASVGLTTSSPGSLMRSGTRRSLPDFPGPATSTRWVAGSASHR